MSGLKDISDDELRAMLRQHAVVIAPGEVLVVMVPHWWAPEDVIGLNERLSYAASEYGFPVLVAPGNAVGVALMPPDPFGEGGQPAADDGAT